MRWGVAGGDGSLAVVAAAAAVHDLPFVCVQAGTRHHFAVDVGVNRHDAPRAIEAFTSGVKRRIDMAEVNGRLYLYGDAVRRPGYRDAKVRTPLETAEACSAPAGMRPRCAWSTTPGASTVSSPSCSCPTTRTRWTARRPAAPAPRSTPASSGLSFSTCLATVRPSRGQPRAAPDLEVSALRSVPAGIDGEAVQLSPPLRFVIRPARLRVRISARHPGASPAARFPLSRA